MGTSSKRAQQPGAFGSKKLVQVIHKETVEKEILEVIKGVPTLVKKMVVVETPHIIGVQRPNRGRNLYKIQKIRRKGYKALRVGQLGRAVIKASDSPSVTAKKPGLMGRAKRLFQRKTES